MIDFKKKDFFFFFPVATDDWLLLGRAGVSPALPARPLSRDPCACSKMEHKWSRTAMRVNERGGFAWEDSRGAIVLPDKRWRHHNA
jgi:hypothetical protein